MTSPTFSIRLPEDARRNLDTATKLTRRSRSFLVKEALDRALPEILQDHAQGRKRRGLSTLLSLGGTGARTSQPRSKQEIDQHVRGLRENG